MAEKVQFSIGILSLARIRLASWRERFGAICFVLVRRTEVMISALDPKDILRIVIDPKFQHASKLRTESIIGCLLHCEAEYGSFQSKAASSIPATLYRLRACRGSRDQLQTVSM